MMWVWSALLYSINPVSEKRNSTEVEHIDVLEYMFVVLTEAITTRFFQGKIRGKELH